MYHFDDPTIESAYRNTIRSASRPYDTVYGTVYFPTNTGLDPLTVDSSNMPTNAITISSQCIDDEALMFGGVFSNSLKLSIITDIDRYAFYNAVVELYYKIEVGEDLFATVPLGVFTVADADRPTNQVNLTAYDNMTMLDLPLGGMFIDGTPWQIFEQVQQHTGMVLGFEEEYLEEFVNHTYQLSASEDRGLQTYRDVVKMVCQQLGCFAYADREGKLNIKEFSIRPDIAMNMSHWYSLVPADYKCQYIGISITSLKGTYTKMVDDPTARGLVMAIEDAPAWDYGLETALQAKTDNLFNLLRIIDGDDGYTPCEIDMPSDATFECGDRLELTLRNGDVIETLITSMEWKFHQGLSITSSGLNPFLEGGSALDSATSRIISQTVAKSKLQFVSFTNANEIVINDNQEAKIGECVINPSADTQALFVATILCDIDDTNGITVLDINDEEQTIGGKCGVTVFYKLGVDSEMHYVPSDTDPYYAIDTLEDGRHIITVTYPLNSLTENTRYEFQVWLSSDGGTITVPQYSLEATILGQEITDITRFDGTIRVEEEYPITSIGYIQFNPITHDPFVVTVGGVFDTTIPNQVFLSDSATYDPEEHPYGWIHFNVGDGTETPREPVAIPTISGTESQVMLCDEDDNQLCTEDDDPLTAEQFDISPTMNVAEVTETVFITTRIADDFSAYVTGTVNEENFMYVGEDFDMGMYNTLYGDENEEEE